MSLAGLIFFTILMLSCVLIIHEAGHYYAVKLCGVTPTKFCIGKTHFFGIPLKISFVNKSDNCLVEFGFYYPSGFFQYYSDTQDRLSFFKKAFISSAGWIAEGLMFLVLITFSIFFQLDSIYYAFVYYYMKFRLIFILTPVTSDGRKFIKYLFNAFAAIFSRIKLLN